MPFIPHTDSDIRKMLDVIGAHNTDDLFDEIPASLRSKALQGIPEGQTEMEVTRLMRERSKSDEADLCFIGAGAYEHHIPAAVWEIASRGEFLTAYTPIKQKRHKARCK